MAPWRLARPLLAAALLLAAAAATPVPPPGPSCTPGTPIANQSSPGAPHCELVPHNASCATEPTVWKRRAMFHPGSECHGENDPNGVMEFNGVYHLFMQDHNPMQLGGHFATRDFVHWRRLGIAIWNDRWYDKAAIWTFSATIGDRGPRIIYPGIAGVNASNGDCGHDSPGTGCFTHALAQPANYSDPWLVDWEKPAQLNPTVRITNGTGINSGSRDPTTAWKTSRGEWRYADAHADIYSSWDFETFHWAGNLENVRDNHCPLPFLVVGLQLSEHKCWQITCAQLIVCLHASVVYGPLNTPSLGPATAQTSSRCRHSARPALRCPPVQRRASRPVAARRTCGRAASRACTSSGATTRARRTARGAGPRSRSSTPLPWTPSSRKARPS